jgi:cobalt-zinc-cadmium efflux system membrane fusion protein
MKRYGSPKRFAPLFLSLALTACRGRDTKDQHHDEHGGAAGPAEQHQDGGENIVRIDRAMLRDLRFTTAPAESRPAGDTVTVLGELRVNEGAYAEIGSPIPARVARVYAAPGDLVTANQPLVELESADVGKARGALNTTKARLDLARQTAERKRGLAADQIVPQRELQAAEAELAQAEAEHRAAQQAVAALGAARGGGARFVLSSPVAGTVIDRTALLGRMTDAEHPLFIVGDLKRLWLVVHAFERDALRMKTNTIARVMFPALPGQPSSGMVTRVGARVDPTSRTVDVRIEVDNPSGLLRPGMSASAAVPLGDSSETVVAVPTIALQRIQDGWCVFLPRGEGVFEGRPIGRGRDLGGEVEIVSGLKVGETVVVEGAFLLKAEADKARGTGEHHAH